MSKSNRSTEIELILSCSKISVNAADIERTRSLLQQDLEWNFIIQTALRHGVMPLLFRNLRRYHSEVVPKVVLDNLQQHFVANAIHISLLAKELVNILELFKSHGIAAIPFKGPTLALLAYNDITLRQSGDLDILVKESNLDKAEQLLVSRGYVPAASSLRETGKVQVFINDKDKIAIDLHWRLAPQVIRSPREQEALWSRAQFISFNNTQTLTLSIEDLLLFLCIHACKSRHTWDKLIWACDIAELSRTHSNIYWEQLLQRADKLAVERMLLLGFSIAHTLLDLTLPETMAHRIRTDKVVNRLTEDVRERIFQGTKAQEWPQQKLRRIRFHLRTREHLRDRLPIYLYNIKSLLTPNEQDHSFISLPRYLSFLYYLIRPIRLGIKYSVNSLNKIKSKNAI